MTTSTRASFYSQNFEDVILARCFSNIEHGFYLDVGAQSEEADSVTRYFYECVRYFVTSDENNPYYRIR